MPDIRITVTNKRAIVEGAPVIVCGNSDYVLQFSFDDEWNAQAYKTARFVYVRDGQAQHVDVDFMGDTVSVPVLSNIAQVRVGVFAGELHTSTPAVIPCRLSILCGAGEAVNPALPTPEETARIMALLNRAIDQQASAEAAAVAAADANVAAQAAAAEVEAIVAGNEAYTKHESDTRFAPVISQTASGASVTLTDSAESPMPSLKVAGKSEQKHYEGVNRCNIAQKDSTTISGVTYDIDENGVITLDGTAEGVVDISCPLATNIQFSLKGWYISLQGEYNRNNFTDVLFHDVATGDYKNTILGTVPIYDVGNVLGAGFGFLDEFECDEIVLRTKEGVTFTNDPISVQIQSGNYSAYEPYVGGKASPNSCYTQPVHSACAYGLTIKSENKNRLDMSKAKGGTYAGIKVSLNEDGSYGYVGTATEPEINVWLMGSWQNTDALFTLKKGTYFIRGVKLYYNRLDLALNTDVRNGGIVTFNADTKIGGVRALSAVTGTTYNEVHYPIIVCLDDTNNTDYEPHKESAITIPVQYLHSVNDVKDEIVCKDGVYGKMKRLALYVFTGAANEWWVTRTNEHGNYMLGTELLTSVIKRVVDHNKTSNMLCSHYIATTANETYVSINGISVDISGNIFVYDNNIQTLEDWLAMLKEKPMTVVFELAEPMFEPFADQTLFYNLQTFKPVTYIGTTEPLQPELEVEYAADTKTYIDNKFAELAAAIAANV